MASLLETQRAYRKRLLAADSATAGELVRIYADLNATVQAELEALTRQITAARLAGEEITQSWLFQEQRYRSLLRQTQVAYESAAATAAGRVGVTQGQVAQLGLDAAQALTSTLVPPSIPLSWSLLPASTIEAFAGFASDGSPLRSLFDALGPEASANIRRSLIRGIGLGYNPRKIAAEITRMNGLALTRALTISRTEVLRAYRQSQSDSYVRNKDILRGKMWHAQLDDRTCPICASQHGTIAGLNEVMGTHPNCRCSWVPVTKSWAELGYSDIADTNPEIEPGPSWLARQPMERQVAILGRGRQAAYASGRLTLPDMVGRRTDRRWGPTRYVVPLGRSLERAARRAA